MTKQEFLAMSMPHGEKAIDKFECIWTIHPYKDALDSLRDNEHLSYENFIKEEGHRLILHPLSDLTKPIEHKGEKFVPIERIKQLLGLVQIGTYFVEDFKFSIKKGALSFNLTMKLIEWHFNLMDKGEEFVDVNTLEENPYK